MPVRWLQTRRSILSPSADSLSRTASSAASTVGDAELPARLAVEVIHNDAVQPIPRCAAAFIAETAFGTGEISWQLAQLY